MNEARISRVYSMIFIAAFLAILLVPLRTLALDPHAIEENFYGRAHLIEAVANLRISLGDRVFPKVVVADGGWLVYTAENDIEGYQRLDRFEDAEMAQIQQALDELSARWAAHGTTLVVVVPPNKNTIYPERVPAAIPVAVAEPALEQLINYLRANAETQILDLRPALLSIKADRQVYYSTDTHWNDLGAFVAYQEIMKMLAVSHPNLTAHALADYNLVERAPERLDLAENIGTTLLPESRLQLAPEFDLQTSYRTIAVGGRRIQFSHNPNSDLPSAIVYHDSFFFRVIPLLGEHFREAMFIQNYMGGGLWTLKWVEERKPDIVIIEFSERYIHDLPLLIDPDE
jgi:alginate O-acetyltransferase complex protein AlgJ